MTYKIKIVVRYVKNKAQIVISVRWVITKKKKDQKLTCLVACGFEELDRNNIRTGSPTCCKENFRLIIVSHKWKIKLLDIKPAFLQGQPINSLNKS